MNLEPHLKRRIGFGLLTAYGVGVMVGAGIYVMIGVVAERAGLAAPLAFIIAGLIAAPTALSYSEFSTRIPEAAGEASWVGVAFGSQTLSTAVGLAIVLAGTVSAAAVLRGGAGYLGALVAADPLWLMLIPGLILTGVAILGVLESLALAAVFTVIELGGLLLVIHAGLIAPQAANFTPTVTAMVQPLSDAGLTIWAAAGLGAVLAFFAFIGFEDIVNMAEEIRKPEKNMPRAILASLVITTALYALVAWAAVRAVPLADLSQSTRPLSLVWEAGHPGTSARFLAGIAVFAALNGVLAQIVMASRVLFGLGRRSTLLSVFHRAHSRFGTPVGATVMLGALVIAVALYLPVATLAEWTSLILLSVFAVVNLALLVLRRNAPRAIFQVPLIVPVAGFVFSLTALVFTVTAHAQ